jgi:hypothetical protein
MLIRSRWFPAALALLAFTCDDAGGVPDDIDGACLRERECQAAQAGTDLGTSDRNECPQRLSAAYDEASGYGCGAAYAEWVSCQATQRGNCPPPIVIGESAGDSSGADSADAEPWVDPCQGAYDAFRRCQGQAQHDECDVVLFGGAGGCSIECALFTGECSAPGRVGESSSCSCDTGDKVGGTFTGQCNEDSLASNAHSACQ